MSSRIPSPSPNAGRIINTCNNCSDGQSAVHPRPGCDLADSLWIHCFNWKNATCTSHAVFFPSPSNNRVSKYALKGDSHENFKAILSTLVQNTWNELKTVLDGLHTVPDVNAVMGVQSINQNLTSISSYMLLDSQDEVTVQCFMSHAQHKSVLLP